MKSISVQELKKRLDKGMDTQIIDVREEDEYAYANIGGELIPMGSVPHNIDRISPSRFVVMVCHAGIRSAAVINYLETNHDFDNLYNLEGGITAWAQNVDPTMPTY